MATDTAIRDLFSRPLSRWIGVRFAIYTAVYLGGMVAFSLGAVIWVQHL